MASKVPAWQVGDAVYGLLVDPDTGLYKVHGVGRIERIEGGTMHLATKKGPKTWGVTDWPAFKSRADGEAYCVEHPGPNHGRQPMAHHDARRPTPEPEWQCLRCERVRAGLYIDDDLDHTRRCPYRGTGRDPEPKG